MIKKYFLVWMLVLALIVPVMTMARENDDNPQDEDDQEEMDDSGQDSESDLNDDDEDRDEDEEDSDDDNRSEIEKLLARLARLQAELCRAGYTQYCTGEQPDPTRTCTLSADFTRDLFFGDQDFGSSKSIEALQKALEKRGILRMPQGAAYGFFGNLTRIALERFQIQNGISEKYKDGYAYAGPQTRRALSGCSGQNPTPLAPTCSLSSNKSSYVLGETITYYWTSQNATYASWQQDNSGKDHLWLPGDRLSANGSQQVRASVVGNPSVTLMVGGVNNGTGSCTKVVNVTAGGYNNNLPPVIHGVSGPTSLKAGERGTWTVRASDPENSNLTYTVFWGDTGKESGTKTEQEISQSARFTHTYSQAGYYSPTFYVSDSSGQQQMTSLSVTVGGGSSRGSHIDVLSPRNGSSYSLNQQLPIYWSVDSNTSLPASGFFYINIFDPSQGKEINIGSTPVNVKSLNWPINGSITPPGKYKLRIYCSYTAGSTQVPCWENNFSGYSGDFTITSDGGDGNHTDLTVSGPAYLIATPSSVQAGGSVTLSAWQIRNQGDKAPSVDKYSNGFYLSTDSLITNTDIRLTGNWNTNLVPAPGETFYWGGPTLTIPTYISSGTYYIGILVDDKNMVAESNEHNNYKSTKIEIANSNSTNYPNIRVTYPNGGERLDTGASYTVRWTGGPVGGKVNIFLVDMRPEKYVSNSPMLVGNVSNTGSRSVQIPANLEPGQYHLRVACQSCTNITSNSVGWIDDSDNSFTIQNPASIDPTINYLKVRSPNGGETLRLGSSQEISWTGGQAGWKVNLFIIDADPNKAVTNQRSLMYNGDNDANQSVVVPSDLTPGDYLIRVACENCSTFPTGWYDDSDAPFKVE